jgi:hypothetical protein
MSIIWHQGGMTWVAEGRSTKRIWTARTEQAREKVGLTCRDNGLPFAAIVLGLLRGRKETGEGEEAQLAWKIEPLLHVNRRKTRFLPLIPFSIASLRPCPFLRLPMRPRHGPCRTEVSPLGWGVWKPFSGGYLPTRCGDTGRVRSLAFGAGHSRWDRGRRAG